MVRSFSHRHHQQHELICTPEYIYILYIPGIYIPGIYILMFREQNSSTSTSLMFREQNRSTSTIYEQVLLDGGKTSQAPINGPRVCCYCCFPAPVASTALQRRKVKVSGATAPLARTIGQFMILTYGNDVPCRICTTSWTCLLYTSPSPRD